MTYRELIYIILDESKLINDDITINEEHVLFLANKYRAALLAQKYKNVKLDVLESNYQTLKLSLEPYKDTYRSVVIPKLLEIGNTVLFKEDYYDSIKIVLVDRERMRFVGENPWTKNIVYCSLNEDNRLYFKTANVENLSDELINITGIFEKPLEASEYEINADFDSLDRLYPIEEPLITTLIAAVVKEIVGAAWRPADTTNNASDDLSDIATFVRRNMKNTFQKQLEE